MLWHDERVTSDFVKAKQYFEKAAASQDELAKENFDEVLATGQGGPKDLARAKGIT